jgi:hypothetical protein
VAAGVLLAEHHRERRVTSWRRGAPAIVYAENDRRFGSADHEGGG